MQAPRTIMAASLFISMNEPLNSSWRSTILSIKFSFAYFQVILGEAILGSTVATGWVYVNIVNEIFMHP